MRQREDTGASGGLYRRGLHRFIGPGDLHRYLRDASAHQGKIALFGLKKKVRTIFDLVRLNELFTITDSADAAVAALAAK